MRSHCCEMAFSLFRDNEFGGETPQQSTHLSVRISPTFRPRRSRYRKDLALDTLALCFRERPENSSNEVTRSLGSVEGSENWFGSRKESNFCSEGLGESGSDDQQEAPNCCQTVMPNHDAQHLVPRASLIGLL